jgi:hypothetical protein
MAHKGTAKITRISLYLYGLKKNDSTNTLRVQKAAREMQLASPLKSGLQPLIFVG